MLLKSNNKNKKALNIKCKRLMKYLNINKEFISSIDKIEAVLFWLFVLVF